jgi:hypothetical protein
LRARHGALPTLNRVPLFVSLSLIYVAGVLATTLICASRIKQDPTDVPGGDWIAVGVIALLWPLVLALGALALILELLVT